MRVSPVAATFFSFFARILVVQGFSFVIARGEVVLIYACFFIPVSAASEWPEISLEKQTKR